MVKGIGGAMDLANGAKQLIVLMEHVAGDGSHELVEGNCCPTRAATASSGSSPTSRQRRNPIGPMLVELAPDVAEDEVREKTKPELYALLREPLQ